MQIQSTSTASALVQHRSTGSTRDDTTNGINPVNASARDKQSENRQPAAQPVPAVDAANKLQTIPNLHIQRVTATKSTQNDVLASSTHSAKRAVQAFQQVDLMSQPELMPRIDTQV